MPEASSLPTVDVRELTRRFGAVAAVDQASFAIAEGEIFGVIGPNGAGKSTLIKMLTTLLPASAGTATIAGYDIGRQPSEVRRQIGYVPQLLSADGSLSGYENMLLSARLYGISSRERKDRIARALARMGLSEAARHLVGQYSGGMIRRLEIAQSLLHRPKVLFLDEPTVGLDPAARDAVWDHVLDLRKTYRTTMVVTSHHLEEINEFCDRIALIDRGRIVTIGTPEELRAKAGPDATLDDVFIKLVGREGDAELHGGYADTKRARRAAREHG
ncbi:MAG TPA: ATP-binding cassette domain-containing protein [Candidatus Cybelea sp.]|nr:ATP-binding cassette domain-containing protein [Candidatus Cybelea sp.]